MTKSRKSYLTVMLQGIRTWIAYQKCLVDKPVSLVDRVKSSGSLNQFVMYKNSQNSEISEIKNKSLKIKFSWNISRIWNKTPRESCKRDLRQCKLIYLSQVTILGSPLTTQYNEKIGRTKSRLSKNWKSAATLLPVTKIHFVEIPDMGQGVGLKYKFCIK